MHRCSPCLALPPVVKGPVRISFRLQIRESMEALTNSSWSISTPVYGEGLRREAAARNAGPGAPHRQGSCGARCADMRKRASEHVAVWCAAV